MRGRKPKTDAERAAEGYRGHNPKRKNQPQAPEGALRCPLYFSDEERSIWDQTLADAPFDVIRPADVEVLIAFCQQVGIARQAMRELKQMAEENRKPDVELPDGTVVPGSTHVMTVETERGWVKNPLVTVLDGTSKTIRSLASELGLSPISRERLGPERQQEKSLRELLSEKPDTPASTKAKPN